MRTPGLVAGLLLLALAAVGSAQEAVPPPNPLPLRSPLDEPWEEGEPDEQLPVEALEDGAVVIAGPGEVHQLPAGRWSAAECAAALAGADTEARRRAVLEAVVLGPAAAELVPGLAQRWQDEEEEPELRHLALQLVARLGPAAAGATAALLATADHELLGPEAARALRRVATPGALPALLEGLRARQPGVRAGAAAALARLVRAPLEPEQVAALVRVLGAAADDEGEDPEVRSTVVWCLGRLGPAAGAALPGLIGALRDDEVASEAMLAVVRIRSPETLALLVAVLREPASEPNARRCCADLLGHLEQVDAAAARAALAGALGDAAPEVRLAALQALLARGGGEELLPRLAGLIRDADEQVAAAAVEVLAGQAPPWPAEVPPALLEAYQDWPAAPVRGPILRALARLGPARAGETLPAFRSAIVADDPCAPDALRGLAALGALAAPALDEVLAHLAGHAHDPASPAWEVLGAIGPGAVPAVTPLLAHEDRRVRAQVAVVLASGGPAAATALEPLRAALGREPYPEVRAALEAAAGGLEGRAPPAAAVAAAREAAQGPRVPPAPLSPLGVGPARARGRPRLEGPRGFEVQLELRGPLTADLVREWEGLEAALQAAWREPDEARRAVAVERAWVNHLAPELRTRADLSERALRRLLQASPAELAPILGEEPRLGDLVRAAGVDPEGEVRETLLVLGERLAPDGQPAPRLIAVEAHPLEGEGWLPSYLGWPVVVTRLDQYDGTAITWVPLDAAWVLERVDPTGRLVLDEHQGLHLRLDAEELARLRSGEARLYVHTSDPRSHRLRAAAEVDRSGPLPR